MALSSQAKGSLVAVCNTGVFPGTPATVVGERSITAWVTRVKSPSEQTMADGFSWTLRAVHKCNMLEVQGLGFTWTLKNLPFNFRVP